MKIRQNVGWSLYQIDPRQQKEDTGGKINKLWALLLAQEMGGEALPNSGFRIRDSGFRIQDSRIQGFKDSGLIQDSFRIQRPARVVTKIEKFKTQPGAFQDHQMTSK